MSGNYIHDLKDFYADARGQRVARLINSYLKPIALACKTQRIIGMGYAPPYLETFSQTESCFAFMSAQQGADFWPHQHLNRTALMDENFLPLETNSVDIIFAIHYLERAQNPQQALNEMWRVLKSNGRLIMVVPNRLGFWARAEWSPFGHGTPYSFGQLRQSLRDSQFIFESAQPILFAPPLRGKIFDRAARGFDYIGSRILPALAGAYFVEARKQLYAAIHDGHGARVPSLIRTSSVEPLPTPFQNRDRIES